MTRNTLLRRVLKTTEISIEVFDPLSLDDEGNYTYNPAVTSTAVVRYQDQETLTGDGNTILTTLTIWIMDSIQGVSQTVPSEQDRVTVSGVAYIVEIVKRVEQFRGPVNHYRCLCRRE